MSDRARRQFGIARDAACGALARFGRAQREAVKIEALRRQQRRRDLARVAREMAVNEQRAIGGEAAGQPPRGGARAGIQRALRLSPPARTPPNRPIPPTPPEKTTTLH